MPTRLEFSGNPARVSQLVQMLEPEGVQVDWQAPVEHRGAADVAESVVSSLLATGALGTIKLVVQRFREQVNDKRTAVTIEGDDSGQDDA